MILDLIKNPKSLNKISNSEMLNFKDLNLNILVPLVYNQPTLRLRKHLNYTNQHKRLKLKDKNNCFDLKLKQINFDLLSIFYTVVILGSFSKAAKRLSVSQPAISLSLRKIEKETGLLLFKPGGPKLSIVLSPAGLIFFNYTQRLFQILEETIEFSKLNRCQNTLNQSEKFNLTIFNLSQTLDKKKSVLFNIKLPLMKFISKKNFLRVETSNFSYYENESKVIVLQRKSLLEPFSSNYKNILSNYLIFDKTLSLKNINNQIYSTLKLNNFIEIQTINAQKTSYDMQIYYCTYW